ncbi:N-acetyltransferase family protein [Nocardioides sp. SYSU DS0651]|uniref:GNAT family N-acetyltransferase n=1 Tax=Nocardioides sp. SYSU DS0651 TaxID=3415955 RepID=UPI003F4B44A3
MEGLVLRPAAAEDAAEVADVHLAARASAPMPASVHEEPEVRAWLTERIAEHGAGQETWVAELDGRVVGYARFTATWLDDLYVDPQHAGRGIGSALLALVKSLRPHGFGLWVFESNRPARDFYGARGLAERERTDGSGNEEGAPDIRMEWRGP